MHRYAPIDPRLLEEPHAHQLFQNVAEHYLGLAGDSFEEVEQLVDVPAQARLVWRLWLFLAEVGGSGVVGYLWNYCHSFAELREIHAALVEVGADELRTLLETGIRSSVEQGHGEFLEESDAREWAWLFAKSVALSDDEVNTASLQVAYPGASEVVASYIRANRSSF